MNVGSTKTHDRKKFDIRRSPINSNIHVSAMKDETKNEYKYFDIGMHVTLFDLNNLEFNRKFGIVKSLI